MYFNDLKELEGGLVFGDAIGCCDVLPFNFSVNNEEPIRSKPLPYPKDARNWIN
jgi:hypothetical protein